MANIRLIPSACSCSIGSEATLHSTLHQEKHVAYGGLTSRKLEIELT
jgi:hypothetical protein